MENELMSLSPGEQTQGPAEDEKNPNFGPLIGSEGEVSGYDWDDEP
jgi:hypothetical protein